MMEKEIERRLSPTEKYLWLIDKQCRINFVMHAKIAGFISETVMRHALNDLQKRHPLLRVKIKRRGWADVWFRTNDVPPIPFRIINDEEEWLKYAEEEINTSFHTEKGPLVRCVVIKHSHDKSTILITFHHSIGDGLSGAFLMRDLLQTASSVQQGKTKVLPALPPRKEMNDYFPKFAKGWRGRLLYLNFSMRVIRSFFRFGLPAMPKIDNKAPLNKRKAHIISHHIDDDVVRKIVERARTEGTTVHGALASALLFSVARDHYGKKRLSFIVGSPVNLRNRLEPPIADDIGFFVTMGGSINQWETSSDFWQVAREIKFSLSECVEKGEPFVFTYQHKDLSLINYMFGSGKLGSKVYSYVADMLSQGLGFTNIGNLAIDSNQNSFFIENIGFAASGSAMCPFIIFASTIDNRMTWNFIGMNPLFTREHIQKIGDDAMNVLHTAISS